MEEVSGAVPAKVLRFVVGMMMMEEGKNARNRGVFMEVGRDRVRVRCTGLLRGLGCAWRGVPFTGGVRLHVEVILLESLCACVWMDGWMPCAITGRVVPDVRDSKVNRRTG
ncbi:hypothetical protein NL676_029064 [Syzygium grande]|nr:hypothetical protein NL676_029064 [Syzygium grande]